MCVKTRSTVFLYVHFKCIHKCDIQSYFVLYNRLKIGAMLCASLIIILRNM